jgi:hypothetical protein
MKFQSIDQVILKSVGKKVLLFHGVAQTSGIVKYVTIHKNKWVRNKTPEMVCLVPKAKLINCYKEMFIDACNIKAIYIIKP